MSKTLPRLLLPYINDRKDSYGKDPSLGLRDPSSPNLGRKKLIVEFSSPNIASEFCSKHLRSTILGNFTANIHENMGWDVVRINYLGDWGKQIGLLGAGWERFGSEEQFQADPIGHMLGVYNQIDELFQPAVAASRAARDSGGDTAAIETQGLFAERNSFFKRMEDGGEEALALWKRFRDVSIEHYIKLYARLNISFDEYSGESQVNPETMDEVEGLLNSKCIFEESEQSWLVDLKKHGGKSGRVIIRDRNGSRTYNLRELAAVLDRARKYSFDKMIYVVADDHDMHFARIIKILDLLAMPDLAHKLQHVHFHKGGSQTSDHSHMLGDILDQCQTAMHDSLQSHPEKAALLGGASSDGAASVAAAIGISALLAHELSARRAADHHPLDIAKATSFARGTGPELQYWHARLCSILSAFASSSSTVNENENESKDNDNDDFFAPIEQEAYIDLLRILAQYPDITSAAYRSLEPATVMAYLWNLVDQVVVVLDSGEGDAADGVEAEVEADGEGEEKGDSGVDVGQNGKGKEWTKAELAVLEMAKQVLGNGMRVLGIRPVVGDGATAAAVAPTG
jgi:arginyl-tRNA synthetase